MNCQCSECSTLLGLTHMCRSVVNQEFARMGARGYADGNQGGMIIGKLQLSAT